MDKITRFSRRYLKFTAEEQWKFRKTVGLVIKPGYKPPTVVSNPESSKHTNTSDPVMNAHFNNLSFEERKKFIQEMSTEQFKKKNDIN